MANKTESEALALAEKTAEELGVYIVDVSYKKEGADYILRYYIDKEGGVGIDDCEEFSKAIDPILDKADPIEGNYMLEVSSPGADRRLTKEREFLYYIGRRVDVKLFKPINGEKEFSGVLTGFADKTAEIDGEIRVPVKEASYIRLAFDF
ncbi:MAG: ribosome maturation factor RimP [Clostridia bacterium]|nr:ribosome maturation factor RimP [Clostridia bacterium]